MATNNKFINNLTDFDSSKLELSPLKDNQGKKSVYINYRYTDKDETPKKLRFKLNNVPIPFGISAWDATVNKGTEPHEKTNDTLNISLENKELYEILNNINELAQQHILKNANDKLIKRPKSREGKPFTIEDIVDSFSNSVKVSPPKDGKNYNPYLQTKLYKQDGEYTGIDVYDTKIKNKKYTLTIENQSSLIPKRSKCNCILECYKMWFINGKFGISWKISQIKVFSNQDSLTEDVLDGEEEEDIEETGNEELGDVLENLEIDDSNVKENEDTDDELEAYSAPRRRRTRKS